MSASQGLPVVARPRASPSSGMARPFGANAAGRISDVRDGEFARSARTRGVLTRRRLNAVRIGDGIVERWNLCQYRVESVGHDISPSRRNCSRQGPACERQPSLKLQSRMPCPCTRRPLDFAALCVGVVCDVSHARRARGGKIPLGDIQTKNYHSHIAMGFEPTSLVEASPTCPPPPICTLAPFPKPRWSEDRGRR